MVNTLHPPLEVIASWPKPNYVNPETRGPALVYLSIILSVLGILMVCARLYSRVFITKAPGFDDILIVFALGFGIVLSVLVIIGNRVWFSGHHIWDIPPDKYVGHRLNVWIASWTYVTALSCVKISVLLFYRRLSVTFSRTFMIATWVGIVYNVAYWVAFCLTLLLLCRPVNSYWDKLDGEWLATHKYTCGNEQISLPISGGLSVLGDFYSALLPMLLIMNLDLPRKQKISLYCLFAIAFLVVGAGIARTVLLNVVINKDYDFTWVLWEMWIWGQVELYVALLAASAPALKPFLRRFLVEPMSSVVDSSGRRKGHGYGSQYADRVDMKNKGWNRDVSALPDDPERIGVAYGGSDMTKSREESFVREVDDEDLETKHFELRQSCDGKKMVPMQIWKKSRSSSSTRETENWPVPAIKPTYNQSQQTSAHIRNFSQPHSYKSSGDTATGLLPLHNQQAHNATQMHYQDQHDERAQALGHNHAMRRLSQGSVKVGRLRAQQQLASSRESSVTSPPVPRSNSRSTNNHPQYTSQQQYIQQVRQQHTYPTHRQSESEGRGSRLDPPSSDESDAGAPGEKEMYVVEKPPWNDLRSASHSRSTSEETLRLPRMGSRDEFNVDLNQRAQRQRQREEGLETARERERQKEWEREREREREREMGRRWRKEGTVRR